MSDYRIEKCYKEAFPSCRFVGKRYKNSDRVDGMYGFYWGKWHENGWFEPLEKLITEQFKEVYPDCEAYIGLMKNKCGESDDYFEYWIGMFLPADCVVPEGYEYIDIDHEAAGICWIKGREENVYCHEGECYDEIVNNGMTIPSEADGGCYMFERYQCPRCTTPDENGEIILDLGFFVEKHGRIKDISELKYDENATDRLEYFNLPDARVIGRSFRCLLDMSAENPIPAFWGKCIENGSLDNIKAMPKLFPAVVGFTDDYDAKTNTFLYIVGVICPIDTPIPDGYTHRDIPATVVSKGKYGDWLDECKPVWAADGYEWSGSEGQFWNAELYLDGEDVNGFRLLCAVMKRAEV